MRTHIFLSQQLRPIYGYENENFVDIFACYVLGLVCLIITFNISY
jgi:hypothetical protein